MTKVWVLLCDGGFDQICYSEREMKREKKDLEAMGFRVKMKPFNSPAEAEKFEDKKALRKRMAKP